MQLTALETLERSLTNQSPTPQAILEIETLRGAAKFLGQVIIETQVPSRERSLAITKLEETVMWAVKGLVMS